MSYSGCAFQEQVDGFNGPSCFPFSHDFDILEYALDLKNHESRGFGFPISYEKNCLAIKHIFGSLMEARDADILGDDYNTSKIVMAHTSNVGTLATSLNLYELGEPPAPDNFETQLNRTFRYATMAPTGGHLSFVLCRCDQSSDYQVQIFWNEKIVPIPGCEENPYQLCRLDKVLQIYPEFWPGSPDKCDIEKICSF